MTSITCVFLVEQGRLASSYLTNPTDKRIQEIMQFYHNHNCAVQVLMGKNVEDLTQRLVIPASELLR
jgi:hypothetical protein